MLIAMSKQPPTAPAPKAYAYIRLSSTPQTLGEGEQRQLRASKKFAKRHGLVIDETLNDLGVSAYRSGNSRKGALGTFLKLVEDGVIARGSMLIVESLDRLTRDKAGDALNLLLALTKGGIRIGITGQNTILDELSYSVMHSVMADLARSHSESEHKSMRSKDNWQVKREKAADGVPVSRQCPLWLVVKRRKFHLLEDRAAIVRRIFEMYVSGIGRYVIASTLRAEGIPPWNKRKPIWHASYIQKLLHNRAVIGEYLPEVMTEEGRKRTETIPNYYPPIIPQELFDHAQNVATTRARKQSGRKGKRFTNLFQKLAKCSACGGPMRYLDRTRDKTRKDGVRPWARYLVCSRALEGQDCTNRQHYNYLFLENFVLAGGLSDVDVVAAAGVHSETAKKQVEQVNSLNAQLAKADAAIQHAVKWLRNPDLTGLDELERELVDQQRKRRELQAQMVTARAVAAEARQAQEDSLQFRHLRELERRAYAETLEGINMSDEAVYARRVRIAMEMRSVIERVECEAEHKVTITTRSGTAYELDGREWTFVTKGPKGPSGKQSVTRVFAGRAVTRLEVE